MRSPSERGARRPDAGIAVAPVAPLAVDLERLGELLAQLLAAAWRERERSERAGRELA